MHCVENLDLRLQLTDLLAEALEDRGRENARGHVGGDSFNLGIETGNFPFDVGSLPLGLFPPLFHVGNESIGELLADAGIEDGGDIVAGSAIELRSVDAANSTAIVTDIRQIDIAALFLRMTVHGGSALPAIGQA